MEKIGVTATIVNTGHSHNTRRIFGPVHENGRFRSQHNDEIHERYHDRQVVDKIRLNGLLWMRVVQPGKSRRAKLDCLKFLTRAGLDRIPVVAPLMIMMVILGFGMTMLK